MPLVRDRCICLRKTEYSETSQILTLFAREHGVLRVIAKGAHRRTKAGASKFDGGLDLLEVGDAVFSHDPARDLQPLTEWSLREGHLQLRQNLRGLYLGLYAAELVGRLIEEHDAHPDLFDRLEATLMDLGADRREQSFLAFQLALLRETGYLAELFACSVCGRPIAAVDEDELTYFSPARGGVVCRNCEGATPDRASLDPRLLRLARGVLRVPRNGQGAESLPQLHRRHTDPLNKLFADHIEHTLGRRLQLAKYVVQHGV